MKQLATFAFALASLVFAVGARAEDSNAAPEKTATVFATCSVASFNDLANVAERAADAINYKAQFDALREFAQESIGSSFFDLERPVSFAILADGESVAPALSCPLRDNPDQEKIEAFLQRVREGVVKIDAKKFENLEIKHFIQGSTLWAYLADKGLDEATLKAALDSAREEFDAPFADVPEDSTPILAFDLNFTKLPKELIEAACAICRQKLAEIASEEDVAEQIDQTFAYYFDAFNCVKRARATLAVDRDANLVSYLELSLRNKSFLAEQLEKSKEAQTRWAAIAELPNPIFVSVDAGVLAEQTKKYNANHFKQTTEENVLNQLDVLVDDPEDFELAKKIVEIVFNAIAADLKADRFDGGFAMLADPPAIVFAAEEASPKELKEAFKLIVERVAKDVDDLDQCVKIDAENVDGFDVSKIDLPCDKISSNLNPYFKGKSIVARLAFGENAVAFVLGLDAEQVEPIFAQILAKSAERAPQPTASTFDFAAAAKLLQGFLDLQDDVRDVAMQSVDRVADAKNAKIVVEESYDDAVAKVKTTVGADLFAAIADVVKLNVQVDVEDDGGDIDDLFDDEEEE